MFPELLKSQRNVILRSIQGMGFDPKEFEWEEVPRASQTPMTVCRYKGYKFNVYESRGHRNCQYSPGEESLSETEEVDSWGDVQHCFDDWLMNMERELREPDLWKQLYEQAETELIPPDNGDPNTPFTPAEIEQITAGINNIQKFLVENAVRSETDRLLIKSEIEYIIHALPKQGRIDWRNQAIGALITLLIALATNSDVASKTMNLFQGIMSHLPKLLH